MVLLRCSEISSSSEFELCTRGYLWSNILRKRWANDWEAYLWRWSSLGPKGVSCLLYRESFAGMIELPVQVEVGHLIRLHRMKVRTWSMTITLSSLCWCTRLLTIGLKVAVCNWNRRITIAGKFLLPRLRQESRWLSHRLLFDGKDDTNYDPIAQSSYTYSFSYEDCHQVSQYAVLRSLISFSLDRSTTPLVSIVWRWRHVTYWARFSICFTRTEISCRAIDSNQ